MATESDNELAECIATPLRPLNDIDDVVASSSADCNYENYEEFTGAMDMALFEADFKDFLKDLMKKTEAILISGEKCDVRHVFEESGVASLKFNLFIWYFLENGKRSDSTEEEVELGALAASCYIAMCALGGSRQDLYQVGLYNLCLKITRNCCTTVRIGETVTSKKGGPKKKKPAPKPDETAAEEDEPEAAAAARSEAVIGPPRITVDSAEKYLGWLTTQFFAFLRSNNFSLDTETQTNTFDFIEDFGRLELDNRYATRAYRANSIREFRTLEKFADRYCAFVHVLIESKYPSRKEMAFGRLIRPRLALLPYPDEIGTASKISTERKRAGDLTVSLILARIARNPGPQELKLIETVLIMIYSQCPDFAEFRTNIAQFIHKILEALPYEYAYDFVQLMNVMFKGRTAGIKSLSNELANVLITNFDFSAPDPGPVPELPKESDSDVGEEAQEEAEEEEKEEEDPPAAQPEKDSEDDDGSDDDDDDGNKSRRRREKKQKENEERKRKKKEKKAAEVKDVERIDAVFVLYNIVYMACLDRAAPMRLHGSHSLAKILDSPTHRVKFQEFCQVANAKMDEKLGEVGAELEDSMDSMNISGEEQNTRRGPSKSKKPTDLLLNDQNILEKWNRLKKINKGQERIEKDIIYMLVRKLATDDKAPVKKSSCVLLKLYLSFCDEQVKFETVLSVIQKLCRDRMVSVRKTSAEAFTDLMLCENLHFKETLSSHWLNSLISMLNDTDSDVVEHARKLIMKVLAPLLENPTDLTWALLDTIERTTNHRNYLMTTLRDAVREKLIQRSVMDTMRARILERDQRTNGAWMVFSQLCVQYHQNVDFVVEEFKAVDTDKESELVKYMTHAIENNINKIDEEQKQELIRVMKRDLEGFTLHASHARSIYYCLGKLMDGIGERAQNAHEFQEFGYSLIDKCFDTIVQSFEMFKDKEEWSRRSEVQERYLCVSLNVATEIFTFSPQLVPMHERFGKTLSLIVGSNDGYTFDASVINPDMPSGHFSRAQTRMSEAVSSQKTTNGIITHEGILFGENVRAVGVITLSNMIIAFDRLLKMMPMLVKQLQYNPSHQIRSNIVVSIGDICASYKTDRYAPMLAASLCDPSVIVRRHAINQIARLISLGIFRFNGEIMIRMMMATLDANEDVRSDAKLYISEVLQSEEPQFFQLNFVQYMIALTQAKRRIGTSSSSHDDGGQIDVAIGGGQPLARASRIAIYTFMIESLNDRARFDVKCSICRRIFMPIINGEYDFNEHNVLCLLDDALLIMGSSEMQIKMEVGKDSNENVIDDPSPEQLQAAQDFMQKVYLEHYLDTIVPSVLALREFLNHHRSPLQRKCLLAIRMICLEHSRDIDKILQDNRQLQDEMKYELNRVKQRSEEAHRILNAAIQKVVEYNKRQKRQSMLPPGEAAIEEEEPMEEQVDENGDVEMASPAKSSRSTAETIADESMKTPEKKKNPALDLLKTPGSALRSRTEERSTPQSRLLSPKTMKKIRRSVGALIQNDMCLNAPNLEDTHVPEDATLKKRNKTIEKEKTVVEEQEEEQMEQDGSPVKEPEEAPEEMPEEVPEKATEEPEPAPVEQEEDTSRRRSRRRKTPNYGEDESIDADGKVWKKPKIGTKSPEKEVLNISSNVTLRRSSRRGRPSTEPEAVVVKKQKPRKRKASSDDDEDEEQVPTTSDNVENTPRDIATPLMFDESKLVGRQCSTPILDRTSNNPSDMTFGNLSAITEKEELKNRKSAAYHLQNIFEEEEDEEN